MIVFVSDTPKGLIGAIGHLPPSAKLVFKVLEIDGQLTQKDLIERTALPSRTVRYALRRLAAEELLIERFHFMDARQSLYALPWPTPVPAGG